MWTCWRSRGLRPCRPELEAEDSPASTVCLLQAINPAKHSRLVRATVTGKERRSLSYFEPNLELEESGVTMAEAAVAADENACVVVVVENHGYVPVELEEGQILGEVQEVELCQRQSVTEEGLVSAVTPGNPYSEERLQSLREGLHLDSANLTPSRLRK